MIKVEDGICDIAGDLVDVLVDATVLLVGLHKTITENFGEEMADVSFSLIEKEIEKLRIPGVKLRVISED